MGETTNEVTPIANDNSQEEASEIRSGIEQTRSHLSATIDALQDKLDPTRIAEQVKDQIRGKATEAFDTAKTAVKDATIGRAEKIMSSVSEAVTDMTERAGTAVSESSSSVVQYIRENPVPIALLGLGLGLLAMKKRRMEPSYRSEKRLAPSTANRAKDFASGIADSAGAVGANVADTARGAAERATSAVGSAVSTVGEAASRLADTTRQKYHDVRDQAQHGAQVTGERLQRTLQENPLGLGMAALAAGALVGLTLPSTRLEGEYLGEARDRLVGQAKSVAQDVVEKVQRVTEEAGETLKSAAQKEGLVAE